MANLHKNAYTCSECGETEVCEQGQDPFEWWLVRQSEDTFYTFPLTLTNEERIFEDIPVQTLCSQECLTKALDQYMTKLTEKAPQAGVNTPA